MFICRRHFLIVAAYLIGNIAFANPEPVELVVPFAPGGASDNYARLLAQELSEQSKKQVIIVNRPGAGGGVGSASIVHSQPDGKTMLLGTISTHAVNPTLYPNLNYDPVKDFTPVARVVALPNVLVVNAKSDITSVDDLIQKSIKKELSFGSPGNGTTSHLAAELMMQIRPEMQLNHIPYRGSAPAITDLIGGHLDVQFDNISALLPHIQSGALRALAISSDTPSEQLPEVQPLAKLGFPGFEITSWFGLWLPKGASPEVVSNLNQLLSNIYSKNEFIQKLKAAGITPSYLEGEAFTDYVKVEQDRWAAVIKKANIKIQ